MAILVVVALLPYRRSRELHPAWRAQRPAGREHRDRGTEDGWPVLLLHGFPYDPHAFTTAADELAAAGARVLAPYLRGFGPTRFTSASTPRSGQQAAIGRDVLNLAGTLELKAPILVGYDWAAGRRVWQQHAAWFPRLLDYRQITSGHNQPFDAPADVASAVRDLHAFLDMAAQRP